MSDRLGCQDRVALFDSVDIADHYRARDICAACPALAECFAACRASIAASKVVGYGPRGTWAGELMTEDRVKRMQAAIERESAA